MSDPFISRQDLTDYLGRDVNSDDGAIIAVDAACEICRDISEQQFNRGTTTEVFDGSGTDALLLPEVPVNSVGTVSCRDSAGSWTDVGTADFSLNGDGVLYATDTVGTAWHGRTWPRGRQNIRVTYDHGYDTIPSSVRRVALELAARTLVQGPAIFENLGDLNIRYALASTELGPNELRILRKHKRTK